MRFQVDYESWFKEKSGTSPVNWAQWAQWAPVTLGSIILQKSNDLEKSRKWRWNRNLFLV
jgi:hypothetical protein